MRTFNYPVGKTVLVVEVGDENKALETFREIEIAAWKERDSAQAEIAKIRAERDELYSDKRILEEAFSNEDREFTTMKGELLSAQKQVLGLRAALEKVLIKVDWNSDEFHNVRQYAETRQIILNALSAPALDLSFVKILVEALQQCGRDSASEALASTKLDREKWGL